MKQQDYDFKSISNFRLILIICVIDSLGIKKHTGIKIVSSLQMFSSFSELNIVTKYIYGKLEVYNFADHNQIINKYMNLK